MGAAEAAQLLGFFISDGNSDISSPLSQLLLQDNGEITYISISAQIGGRGDKKLLDKSTSAMDAV